MRSSFEFGFLLSMLGLSGASLGCMATVAEQDVDQADQLLANNSKFGNSFGQANYFSTTGSIDATTNNPFFRNLGMNGRTCNSCHKLEDGLGISVARINTIFNNSQGMDPIFRLNDGSNAPSGPAVNVSSLSGRRTTYSMLLDHGVIRVGQPLPATRDFELVFTRDPYFFASANELSLFRRPLPSVNVKGNVLAMWDGRESEGRPAIRDALINQANDATMGHAQGAALDMTTRQQIADFQLGLFNAQSDSTNVGSLTVAGCAECENARGGAQNVRNAVLGIPGQAGIGSEGGSQGALAPFSEGVNDPFRFGGVVCAENTTPPLGPNASCFKNVSMTFFDPFESDAFPPTDTSALTKSRSDLGDGENIFYTKPMFFTTAGGGTEVPGLSANGVTLTKGTCTTCHNTPEVGSHSAKRFFNTGVADPFVGGPNNRANNPLAGNLVSFPFYSIGPKSNPNAYTTTTDPGLALRTGKIADLGKFKVPNLRGLGSRAPYFHNGSAKTLNDVVTFYNIKFGMKMTTEEIRKVVLFLQQT